MRVVATKSIPRVSEGISHSLAFCVNSVRDVYIPQPAYSTVGTEDEKRITHDLRVIRSTSTSPFAILLAVYVCPLPGPNPL